VGNPVHPVASYAAALSDGKLDSIPDRAAVVLFLKML
jgi:hypothetical protein